MLIIWENCVLLTCCLSHPDRTLAIEPSPSSSLVRRLDLSCLLGFFFFFFWLKTSVLIQWAHASGPSVIWWRSPRLGFLPETMESCCQWDSLMTIPFFWFLICCLCVNRFQLHECGYCGSQKLVIMNGPNLCSDYWLRTISICIRICILVLVSPVPTWEVMKSVMDTVFIGFIIKERKHSLGIVPKKRLAQR